MLFSHIFSATHVEEKLQQVLSRYVDSEEGYLKAAESIRSSAYAQAFREISTRRQAVILEVATMLSELGGRCDVEGSPEGDIHRCWLKIRAGLSDGELEAVLKECLRGEKELLRSLRTAIRDREIRESHREKLEEISIEVAEAVETFETSLNL